MTVSSMSAIFHSMEAKQEMQRPTSSSDIHLLSPRAYPADNFGGQQTYYQFFAQDGIRLSEILRQRRFSGMSIAVAQWLQRPAWHFRSKQIEANPMQGRTDQVDLTSQFAHRRPISLRKVHSDELSGWPAILHHEYRLEAVGPRVGFAWSPFRQNDDLPRRLWHLLRARRVRWARQSEHTSVRSTKRSTKSKTSAPTRTLANYFLGTTAGSLTTIQPWCPH